MFINAKNENEWKEIRYKYLTASDAGNYCGVNPYDKNGRLHLWEEKVGIKVRPDIGDKPAVIFGKNAEEHLRALFLLRHPEFKLQYDQYGLWVCDERPFMAATLDGLLIHTENGKQYILEIKTGTVHSYSQLDEWKSGELPINYWCQVLHQLKCKPNSRGAYVYAYIQTEWNPQEGYMFEFFYDRNSEAVQTDMKFVTDKAIEFWSLVNKKERPVTVIKL